MMSQLSEDVQFSLKVMLNKQKTKVLFAEADSKFAEVILGFLTMPLGEIVRILKRRYGEGQEPVVGSLNFLYEGLLDLDGAHFWTDGGKKMLLNPRNSFFNQPVKYFKCGDMACSKKNFPNISMYYDSGICDCGKPLSRAMTEVEPKSQTSGDGILAQGLCFLVTDDLQMAPYEPGSMIQTFIDLGIVVSEGAELLNVTLGYNEIVDLLKGSLLSETPLTDTIFRVMSNDTNCELEDSDILVPEPSSTNSKTMTVTAVMQKSTNKLLYIEANEDFVDFILSFLTIPLGRVLSLLGGKTSLRGIDNVYNSTTDLINDKHFMTKDVRKRLLEPELPPYYVSKNQIFAVSEQTAPPIYYCASITDSSNQTVEGGFWMRYKDPKGDQGCYVKGTRKFLISKSLTVKPSDMSSKDIIRSLLRIPLSEIEEMELQIGLKEGLSILKASLASKSALIDGLINPILKPHQSI